MKYCNGAAGVYMAQNMFKDCGDGYLVCFWQHVVFNPERCLILWRACFDHQRCQILDYEMSSTTDLHYLM